MNGLYPVEKDEKKALEYFSKAAENNYAFSLNNLGKYYEDKDKDLAFSYYLKSASLGESWACNKVGECYRKGFLVVKDEKKAYHYYLAGIDASFRTMYYYNYYNLANYYIEGRLDLGIEKDINKALEYYKIASDNGVIDASIRLLYYYVRKYLQFKNDDDKRSIYYYKKEIELNEKYNDVVRLQVESAIKEIYKNKDISLDYLFE